MPQNPPSATTPAEQHAEGVPERILVVEDDKVIRALVTTTLESRGISFLTAATGREALAEASRANPDVILLDLGLPDMDGVEIIRAVRQWSMSTTPPGATARRRAAAASRVPIWKGTA